MSLSIHQRVLLTNVSKEQGSLDTHFSAFNTTINVSRMQMLDLLTVNMEERTAVLMVEEEAIR